MEAAIERGPHASALTPEAIEHFRLEVAGKVATGQARVVEWDEIRNNPPEQLKISPIAAIPHKSKAFRSILDLSFRLRLQDGGVVLAVNDTSTKTAPQGAIDQIGHSLKRIIHAFAEAGDDEKIFMAKWDVKDGFWRLQCRDGEEWNFAYVLPQEEGSAVRLVVPTSLQMGWIESPPYFCAASETARDVAAGYIETAVGSLPRHRFEQHTVATDEMSAGGTSGSGEGFKYVLEVYVDDFMSLVIPTSAAHLQHVANAVMKGIHDVFPEDADEENDPISLKKLRQGDGRYSTRKCILGFDFDGDASRRKKEHFYSPSCTGGSGGHGKRRRELRSRSLNRSRRSYDMHSPPYRLERGCFHHAMGCCGHTQRWCTCIEASPCSKLSRMHELC